MCTIGPPRRVLRSGVNPMHYAGTKIVEFSPTDVLEKTIKVVMSNLHLSDAS